MPSSNPTLSTPTFDPTFPSPNTVADAVQVRGQFNALKALIDANTGISSAQVDGVNTPSPGSPANVAVSVHDGTLHFVFDLPQGLDGPPGPEGQAGPEGPMGPPGETMAAAVVDAVETLEAEEPATATASVDGTTVRFNFGIPRGAIGGPGPQGEPGPMGPEGPAVAAAAVDAVETLEPEAPATVSASVDGTTVHFAFGIPRGADGAPGPQGATGLQGIPGPQGPMGEMSQAQLDDIHNNTSANTNAVTTLDTAFENEPPTLADLETLRAKINELILAARR